MVHFLKKIFGANNSNTEIEELNSSNKTKAEEFKTAIIEKDIDYIISYVEAGNDVNVELTETRHEWVDIHFDSEYTEYLLPLDYVRNPDIEQYLRKHGAITYQEFSERKKLEQLEEEKKNQEKRRQKELEWKREQIKKEEYIRQRIAEVEA